MVNITRDKLRPVTLENGHLFCRHRISLTARIVHACSEWHGLLNKIHTLEEEVNRNERLSHSFNARFLGVAEIRG